MIYIDSGLCSLLTWTCSLICVSHSVHHDTDPGNIVDDNEDKV